MTVTGGSGEHGRMTEERTGRVVDVLIVGGGPAGLAAAQRLAAAGAGRVEVIERESEPGGIPRHSQHPGYGMRDLHRMLSGPAYARHYATAATAAGARLRTGVTVTGWAGPQAMDVTGPDGLERIEARAIVLATGARERPRSARLVPGGRPAGVYTTGRLQQEVYLHGQSVGTRAVIVGTEHVSYSASVTLRHAGVRVAAMLTEWPRQQSYRAFQVGAQVAFGFPVLTRHAVVEVLGRHRVSGVRVRRPDGTTGVIACDTVVFTGDWIPDHELVRHGALNLDPGTRGPAVDTALGTSAPGVFAAGNLVHPVETADNVALDGRDAARSVLGYLATGEVRSAGPGVPVRVRAPLAWVAPNVLRGPAPPPRGRFILWARDVVERPVIEVRQGERTLCTHRPHRTLLPGRPYYLPDGWLTDVKPHGPPVAITAG